MATANLSAQATESNSLPEWQEERIKMARNIRDGVLNPIMTFSRLITDDPNGLDEDEIGAVLRLLVMGGYEDLKICCVKSGGGHVPWVPVDFMETIDEE